MLAVMPGAVAQDIAREKRMADEIVDAILDGEPIWLRAGGNEFLAIYTEAESAKGTVILTHGRGFHPDWAQVVGPLRVGLAEAGWNTLSIQMPVLGKAAKYYDYIPIFPASFPRLEAALAFAAKRAKGPKVLLAHSCSVHMSMAFVRARGAEGIDAYIGIGMGATDYKQPMREPFPLDRMHIPILDIYGSEDYPAVRRLAVRRAELAARAGNQRFTQVVVAGADHYFNARAEALLDRVSVWLSNLE